MQRKRAFWLLAATAATLSWSSVFAFNQLFMKHGPLSHLTGDDVKIATEAIQSALDDEPDGKTRTWINSETKASGTITPIKTFTKDGMRCRSAAFTTSAGGQSGQSTWDLCNTKDGWKVLTEK